MKIEIEFEEIEKLKKQIRHLEMTNQELNEKLKSLNAEELEGKAVELSVLLFNNYMESIFIKLGFDPAVLSYQGPIRFEQDLRHWLGEKWYKSERLNVEIGATITNQFRNAFLSLGIRSKGE